MIYHCPDCGVYWYIIAQYLNKIEWKAMDSLIITNPNQTIKRACPRHHRISAEVKA